MKDSANVADLISQGKCQYYEYPLPRGKRSAGTALLKETLKKAGAENKLRIRNNLVALYFPEMDRYYDRHEAENLAIVKYCLAPSEIASMQYNDFVPGLPHAIKV